MALQRYRSYLYTMKAQDKLQEAGGKFKKGVKFIDVCYPLSTKQCIQLEDEVFIKSQWPNLLWVRAFAPIGVAMDCVIYDSNMDKWATFEALPKKEAKPLIYVNPLQIKKGDVVVCNDGRKGRIIKYPSNQQITIEDTTDSSVTWTLTKNDIKTVFSHG